MGFKIVVKRNNDDEEVVWETDNDMYQLVDRVSVTTSRGEATSLGIDNSMDRVILLVNERDIASTNYGDIQELVKQQENEAALIADNEKLPVVEEVEEVPKEETPAVEEETKEESFDL